MRFSLDFKHVLKTKFAGPSCIRFGVIAQSAESRKANNLRVLEISTIAPAELEEQTSLPEPSPCSQ